MLLKEESVVTLYLVGKNVNNFTRHSLCKRLHGGNTRGHIQGEWRLEISNFEYLILFLKYAATTDIHMIIHNTIRTFWIKNEPHMEFETLITKLTIRLKIGKAKEGH